MKLLDIILAPWAISEPRLGEIRELYLAHTRREKVDLRTWEAASGRPTGDVREPYQVRDGVAVIPLSGVLTKVDSAWNRICGMTSTAQVRADLQTALADPTVQSILLHIDSPGGMVDGTQQLAGDVFAARAQKPVLAFADGCMCSAALWIGAAAERVYIASDTTEVGSIGVVATHVDVSVSEGQTGRKTTEITAGRYKRIASQYAPLSEEGRATIQAQVDHIYTVFVEDIAKFRGASVDAVLAEMADGRVFLGKQAIEARLVDGVSTVPALVAQLNQDRSTWTPGAGAASQPQPTTQEESIMDLKELREKHPEHAQALIDEGQKAGATAELTRVIGCLDAAIPGYEGLAREKALDGKTTPGETALAINAAQKADLSAAYKKTQEGGPDPLPSGGDPEALDADAAKKKADEAKQKNAEPTSKDWTDRINAHIAKAGAEGRNLSAAQAAAELRQQDKE